MAKHAHSFGEAHEMETLQEGTWYIRGCKELEGYFKTIERYMDGGYNYFRYYIEGGKWYYSPVNNVKHRTEITLQDYLDSLKPQSFDELDLEFEEKEKGSIEFLKSRGYFVFPKAEEGDFPDLSGFDGVEMEVAAIKDLDGRIIYRPMKIIVKNKRHFITSESNFYDTIRPIQKQKLTLAELAEKAGLDINNIEIIE